MGYKCIIIDDEPLAVQLLESYIEKTPFLVLEQSYASAVIAMEHMSDKQGYIVFLDISMPGMDGLSFARCVPQGNKIIFTTAYSQYAAESYRLDATDYLLKPFSYECFLSAVNKAIKTTGTVENSEKAGSLWIKSSGKYMQVVFDHISYIEGVKDYVNFHFTDNRTSVLSLIRMKKLEEMLPENFCRIHKSYIVNLNYVTVVDKDTLVCAKKELSIGNNYKKQLYEKINVTI